MLERATERLYACWCRKCDEFVTKVRSRAVRALVVTNMWPSAGAPQRGCSSPTRSRRCGGATTSRCDVFAFPPGPRALLRAIATIAPPHARRAVRRRPRALRPGGAAGARRAARPGGRDAARQRPVRARAPGASRARRCRSRRCRRRSRARSAATCPGAGTERRVAVLPVGIALERFRPIPRAEARAHLGLDPAGPYLLFPHDPVAAAEALRPRARGGGRRAAAHDGRASRPTRCRTGSTPPTPCSCRRRTRASGSSVIEALACGVPAFGTPVGIHPRRAARDRGRVLRAVGPRRAGGPRSRRVLAAADPRVDGRARAELFSADRDGRARGRGVARGRRRTRRRARSRAGDRPILGVSSASATALADRP